MEKKKFVISLISRLRYWLVNLRKWLLIKGKTKAFSKWFKFSPIFETIIFLSALFGSFSMTVPLSVFGTKFNLGFYFSLIGIVLCLVDILFKEIDQKFINVVRGVSFVFVFFLFTSLFMALVQYPFFKGYHEYNYWLDYIKGIIKWGYNAVCFCYIVFSFHLLKQKQILIWTYASTYLFLLLTIAQFAILKTRNETLALIYDKIDVLNLLHDSSYIFKLEANSGSFRAFGFSSEPASVQAYSCVIWIPTYIWFWTKEPLQKKRLIFHIISFAVALILIFLTMSSSVYIFALLVGFVLLCRFLTSDNYSFSKKATIVASLLTTFLVLIIVPTTRSIITRYLTKIIDFTDYSTLNRYSSIWDALCIFVKFPLFGVGDCFQGLYYFDNIQGTVFQYNAETQTFLFEGYSLGGGGAMIPSIISGFGLLGIGCFIAYIVFSVKLCKSARDNFLSFVFLTTIVGAIASFTASSGIYFSFFALFYFALPLSNLQNKTPAIAKNTYYSVEV
jgi:hypothetical protein